MNEQGKKVKLTEGEAKQRSQQYAQIESRMEIAKKDMRDAEEFAGKLPENHPFRKNLKRQFEKAEAEWAAANAEKAQNPKVQYAQKPSADVNLPLLKAKLKNMVRQVRDYPELKHKIGGLNIMWNQNGGPVMVADTYAGAKYKAKISYDAYLDRDTPEGEQRRQRINNYSAKTIGNLNNAGNHELGHVQESILNPDKDRQWKGVAANDILQTVLPKVLDPNEMSEVRYHQQDGLNASGKKVYKGRIDTQSPVFKRKALSSPYGMTMSQEWFGEAFHDVYTKGADAKPTSIEIVKEYERRQTANQISGFEKKKRGWLADKFVRVKRWFSKFWNYGRRPGDPQPAAAEPLLPPQINEDPQPAGDPAAHDADNIQDNYDDIFADTEPTQEYKENVLDKAMFMEDIDDLENGSRKKKKKKNIW